MSVNEPPWATLMAHCQKAQSVLIAAPYMKAGPLAQVLSAVAQDAAITCVSRWTPPDVRSGATDLACRELALARGGRFLLHDRLHAKYYRFDNRILIGSSNLTQAGMNIAGPGNLEILCPPPTEFDAMQFERLLLKEAYPVSDSDFNLWSRITPIQQVNQATAPRQAAVSLDTWKPTTRRPEYLWLAYQQRVSEIPLVDQQEIAIKEIEVLAVPTGLNEAEFNNWIALSLMTVPFVNSVLAGLQESSETAREQLSQQWDITKAEAERCRTTTQNWLEYFRVSTSSLVTSNPKT